MVGDKEVGGGDLPTIADDLVVTKYKMAAEIVNSELMTCTVLLSKIFVLLFMIQPFPPSLSDHCSYFFTLDWPRL